MKTMIVIIAMLVSVASYGQPSMDRDDSGYAIYKSLTWCPQRTDRFITTLVAEVMEVISSGMLRKSGKSRKSRKATRAYFAFVVDRDRDAAWIGCMGGYRQGVKLGYELGRTAARQPSKTTKKEPRFTFK